MRSILVFLALLCMPVSAQEVSPEIFLPSKDIFKAEQKVKTVEPINDDLFATGFSIEINERIEDDAHLIGFQVEVDEVVGGNLYASGALVDIDAPVLGDVTATGFDVDIGQNVEVGGNTRLAGRKVNLAGTINGSASIAADVLILEGVVMGDVSFIGRTITFSDDAKINGALTYRTPSELKIPSTVVKYDLVHWEPWNVADVNSTLEDQLSKHGPSIWSLVSLFLGGLAAVIVLAMLFLSIMPRRIEKLRTIADCNYKRTSTFGFFTLAALFGLVPVTASTIVAAPLLPLVLFFIVVAWLLGYFLGVYTISYRICGHYFANIDSNIGRLLVLIAGLFMFAILNVIPVLGWLLNLFGLFLGLGAVSIAIIERQSSSGSSASDQEAISTA